MNTAWKLPVNAIFTITLMVESGDTVQGIVPSYMQQLLYNFTDGILWQLTGTII
jgi:hypothetical protein